MRLTLYLQQRCWSGNDWAEYAQRKEELLKAKAEVEEILRYESVDMADPQVVQDYADDLRSLLVKSSITEQRSFLKSFVKRIEVDESEAKVHYTIPILP